VITFGITLFFYAGNAPRNKLLCYNPEYGFYSRYYTRHKVKVQTFRSTYLIVLPMQSSSVHQCNLVLNNDRVRKHSYCEKEFIQEKNRNKEKIKMNFFIIRRFKMRTG